MKILLLNVHLVVLENILLAPSQIQGDSGTGARTQTLMHVKQVFYHQAISPVPLRYSLLVILSTTALVGKASGPSVR